MKNSFRHRPWSATIILVLAAFCPGGGFCEAAASSDYVVAVADFSAASLPPSMDLFLSSFPRLLVAELAVLPTRHEDSAYRAEKAAIAASRTIFDNGADLMTRLDDLALKRIEPGIDPHKRSRNIADSEAGVAAAKARLEQGPAVDAEAKPGSLDPILRPAALSALNDKGALLHLDPAGPRSTVRGKSVDLLIYGRVEAVGPYVAVEIVGFDIPADRELFSFRTHADPADPSPVARDIAERICRLIAGRPYGRIDFSVAPASATIAVDGRVLETSTRRLYVFDRQSVLVTATAPGCQSFSRTLVVAADDRILLDISLSEAVTGEARISTLPSGLPVFVDGLPVGNSPATAILHGERSVANAYSGDVSSATTILGPDGRQDVTLVPMDPSLLPGASVDKRRNDFYDALGYFLISLPPTSISYGVNSLFYDAWARGGDESMSAKYEASGLALGVFAAVSAGLAVNAIIRLIRYISSAN